MSEMYPFEPVLVRNRLGQGMTLRVYPFSLSSDHVCILVKVTDGAHHSVLKKNAENIVFQLRERFSRSVKNFSMIEIRCESGEEQVWYTWQFNWVGNTPLDAKCQVLSSQQVNYYQTKIAGFNQAAGDC